MAEKNLDKLHPGATFFKDERTYPYTTLDTVYCVGFLFGLVPLKHLISSIDPKAFVVINETMEVIGRKLNLSENFDYSN